MLPPGHIAGAYLTTTALLTLTHPHVTSGQVHWLIGIGIFFGIAPDFDFFYGFIKNRILTASEDKFDHRTYLSHAPILWLIPALLLFLLAPDPFWKTIGLLIWVGSWTHFFLDSIEHGVMWLWPFTDKPFSLIQRRLTFITKEERFFPFWTEFLFWYAKNSITCYLEILTVIVGLIAWMKIGW